MNPGGHAHSDKVESFIIRNEFAAVEVTLDLEGNDARLKISDLRSGRVAFLDALELEGLSHSRHDDLGEIVDPHLADLRADLEML